MLKTDTFSSCHSHNKANKWIMSQAAIATWFTWKPQNNVSKTYSISVKSSPKKRKVAIVCMCVCNPPGRQCLYWYTLCVSGLYATFEHTHSGVAVSLPLRREPKHLSSGEIEPARYLIAALQQQRRQRTVPVELRHSATLGGTHSCAWSGSGERGLGGGAAGQDAAARNPCAVLRARVPRPCRRGRGGGERGGEGGGAASPTHRHPHTPSHTLLVVCQQQRSGCFLTVIGTGAGNAARCGQSHLSFFSDKERFFFYLPPFYFPLRTSLADRPSRIHPLRFHQ